ncbi:MULTISPECIES: PilZ-like domain-containing protein [Geobacter]|uniref:Pilus assembly protein PilZ n=2 Tax=Geobacter TaxID=28231 RepID=A0A0C1QRB0_9BACT|nr:MULTISPECIES: PilZ-like domain-containing protein [Geobacter]ANA41226.1 pilus assembly protein PilZ [Geobacter anodireducens]KIE43367.1 pilus assembly protein PilZ [Geobacter soli]MBE2887760.1 DUF5634 family protein [Geobacter anodireducens]HMN03859.1 DUF5634 family protein [Geobacter anodireducens]
MSADGSEYGRFFEQLQKINLTVRLGDVGSFDGTAAITSLKGSLAWLELFGAEQPPAGMLSEGAEVSVSVWTGGALCRCDGRVETVRDDRQFAIRLAGRVRELQRREYFRLDVSIPFSYELLPGMSPEEAQERWLHERMDSWRSPAMAQEGSSWRVVDWNGRDIPSARANLSGGGMRFRVSEEVASGTLMLVSLFLPHPQPRMICVLAEALRCSEITLTLQAGTHYSLSMRFITISDKDREAVISYLFSEQRRELMSKSDRIQVGGRR